MIKKFIEWVSNLFKKDRLYEAVFINDVPDIVRSKSIYIIQNEGYNWQAVMVCPCGCKKILYMNLMKEYHPSWKLELGKNKVVTLHPSINRMIGCKSHFFIRKGKVKWC